MNIPVRAVEELASKLDSLAEREERLLAEGLHYREDRIAAAASARAWRTAAQIARKLASPVGTWGEL